MILYRRKNNEEYNQNGIRLSREPYLVINTLFAGVILLIFAYSGIFSPEKDNYPVTCIHEKITGLPCVSCGLSHSFSLIVRGRIEEAYQWNHIWNEDFPVFCGTTDFKGRFFLFLCEISRHPETADYNRLCRIGNIISDCFLAFYKEHFYRRLKTDGN